MTVDFSALSFFVALEDGGGGWIRNYGGFGLRN
jgi:hypothetical protein